ncbi:E3 ubiquitin-protein ligase TRAIP [Spodoptera frugiperda]|uniref:E3 ubiquitin-protein ligase TRAIP n=2 Tax=Spodoptera frugiperda TaxID=7108 RepID=A0A9R0ERS2_SPOFR|nr:E3 ubiquitin-protein ligase TRAIP [Spodoptera frugiperda]
MHILCTICSDLVNQAENIFVTKCGHIFHHHCLVQWIERSKTCPQCRNKVTDKCMFRLFPTISNENNSEDAATLQSRLDDAQLQLRQQRTKFKEKEDKLVVLTADLKRQDDLLKSYEKRLVSFDSKVLALREQLEILNVQNKELHKVKEENLALTKNMQTLNGLQRVLNATSDDVEQMLHSYTDVKTIATFATALKRALCDSETKKNETRDRLHMAKQQLALEKKTVADLRNQVVKLEDDLHQAQNRYDSLNSKYETLKNEKEISDLSAQLIKKTGDLIEEVETPPRALNDAILETPTNNTSFNTLVQNIENSDSPYLNLKQGSLFSVAVLQRQPIKLSEKVKPSENLYLNSIKNATMKRLGEKSNSLNSKHSIFHKKEPMKIESLDDRVGGSLDISYDGLGGHSKLDTFPVPNRTPVKSCIPKLSAKHKLKRPNPAGSQDIEKMLKKVKK